jgi:pyruvate dehydrogenase E2 component (dihydrolipoamide acetyltransferase)
MAQNMARSGAEVVPATVTEEAHVSHWPRGSDVTVKLILALQAAIAAEPRLNAWYESSDQTLRLHGHVNLGLAQDTPEGLFVPTLRLDGTADAAALRRDVDRLKIAVLERGLSPTELSAQTITLSNFGMIAGIHASLVIVPPQVAIVGSGRMVQRVAMADGVPRAATMLPLSLTFDHRAISGGEAVRFLKAMVQFLEAH